MPSKSKSTLPDLLYVGIKGSVVALQKSDGKIAWSVRLPKGSSFVPIVQQGERLYAASSGEVSCLDAASGKVLWHNPLKGFGSGYASLAGAGFPMGAAQGEQTAAHAAAMSAIIAASAAG